VTTGPTRVEKDLLGEKAVPADAYYGVQTARALENFQISGIPINHYPGFVEAWAIVKLAAARANTEVGAMKPETLAGIEKATAAVLKGQYHDQFLVDWYQGGAGTSTNMNANEVLANVALDDGTQKGTIRSSTRTTISTCRIDKRLVSDGDQGSVDPAQRQADRRTRAARSGVSKKAMRTSIS
jgi:aspartate ammonia-lyase